MVLSLPSLCLPLSLPLTWLTGFNLGRGEGHERSGPYDAPAGLEEGV